MAYSVHSWSAGEPITKNKMDNIESGIVEALRIANNALTSGSDIITTMNQTVGRLNTTVGDSGSGLVQLVNNLSTSYREISNNANTAYANIIGATTSHTPYYDSLLARFRADEGNIQRAYDYADDVFKLVDAARQVGTIRIDWSRIMCPDSLVCPKGIKQGGQNNAPDT